MNFQEDIPGKVRFQKKWGGGHVPRPPYPSLGSLELPKMLVFFEILTSDDMQDDASDMLQFLWSIKKWSKLGQKTDILTHFKVFCYTHLHPMSYTPRYCQMKDIIKIYICGKLR